jgi:type II secretory pathway component PulK
MDKIKKNNNGAALIIALGVLLFLSVLGSAIFLRYASEHVLSQREKGLTQAFYNAEEGIHYAYAELNQHNFDWNTHTWSGTTSLIKNTVTSSLIGSGYEGKFNTD